MLPIIPHDLIVSVYHYLDFNQKLILNQASQKYNQVFWNRIYRPDKNRRDLVFHASRKGLAKIVHLLIEKRFSLNYPGTHYMTPLHICANYGFDKIVQILLAHGANKHLHEDMYYFYKTPLEWSLLYRSYENVEGRNVHRCLELLEKVYSPICHKN